MRESIAANDEKLSVLEWWHKARSMTIEDTLLWRDDDAAAAAAGDDDDDDDDDDGDDGGDRVPSPDIT
jgi:hypothetical protein